MLIISGLKLFLEGVFGFFQIYTKSNCELECLTNLTLRYESVTFKMTHFVFHVTQKHFIIWMLRVRVSLLLHIMKNKMCHFEYGLIYGLILQLQRVLHAE